jgi:hypothetical protein
MASWRENGFTLPLLLPGSVADAVPAITNGEGQEEGDDRPPPAEEAAAASASGAAASSAAAPKDEPKSVAEAKRDAKAETDAVRSRAANTMHAVARLMANPELISQIRLICLATRSFALSNAECTDALKGYENNQKQYTKWANWFGFGQLCPCWMGARYCLGAVGARRRLIVRDVFRIW